MATGHIEFNERPVPGMIVRHFKRELEPMYSGNTNYLYYVLYFGTHSETKEKFVVYKSLYNDREVHIRPYDMFMSEVDKNKYPNIKQRYRFEKANPQDLGHLLYNIDDYSRGLLTSMIVK